MTGSSTSPRRFAHLWFDRLCTDRLRASHAGTTPLAVVRTHKNAMRLAAVDETAQAEGLAADMTLADARAHTPQVTVVRADPDADLAFLMRLGEACRRYTPAVALCAPDGLDLDVTGCAGLFGGEEPLLASIGRRMRRARLSLRLALADTPAQAYGLARYADGGVTAPGAGGAAMAALPVAALRLDPRSCEVLRGLGLHRVDQVLRLPRAALARRLDPTALDRLDEAVGRRAAPLELQSERLVFRADRPLSEPVCEPQAVLIVVSELARELVLQLEGRGVGGRRFGLELFRLDGAVKRLVVAASRPQRTAERICALFVERLAGLNEGLEADFGFDHLRLTAEVVEPGAPKPLDLLRPAEGGSGLGDLADRIAARSGARMRRLQPGDAHAPERAEVAVAAGVAVDWSCADPPRYDGAPMRPARLFRPPQPIEVGAAEVPEGPPAGFTWRRVQRTVVRAEGPERIEPEWASGDPIDGVRDYYRLEDEAGRRYWVFRQGRYDRAPQAPPRWYLHGLFG